jgi:hypothetical protein
MEIICPGADLPARHDTRLFRFAHCIYQEQSPMLTHTRAAVAPRRALPSPTLQPPDPWAALLDSLGAIEDEENVIVLGTDGPDLMCALLRAGAPQVTHLRTHERLEAGSASLVIVPQMISLDWLATALPSIRRALGESGRLAICVDPLPATQSGIRRLLTQHGFAAVRSARAAGRQVLSAEVPSFGLRRSA